MINEWEREKAFWASQDIDTYDIEEQGDAWSSYRDMALQVKDPTGAMHGDWIRAEDYLNRVEGLYDKLSMLEEEKDQDWAFRHDPFPPRTVEEETVLKLAVVWRESGTQKSKFNLETAIEAMINSRSKV